MSDLLAAEQINEIEGKHKPYEYIGILTGARQIGCANATCWDGYPCEKAQLVAHCRALEARLERVEKAGRGLLDVANHERLCEELVGGHCRCVLGERLGAWYLAAPTRAGDGEEG